MQSYWMTNFSPAPSKAPAAAIHRIGRRGLFLISEVVIEDIVVAPVDEGAGAAVRFGLPVVVFDDQGEVRAEAEDDPRDDLDLLGGRCVVDRLAVVDPRLEPIQHLPARSREEVGGGVVARPVESVWRSGEGALPHQRGEILAPLLQRLDVGDRRTPGERQVRGDLLDAEVRSALAPIDPPRVPGDSEREGCLLTELPTRHDPPRPCRLETGAAVAFDVPAEGRAGDMVVVGKELARVVDRESRPQRPRADKLDAVVRIQLETVEVLDVAEERVIPEDADLPVELPGVDVADWRLRPSVGFLEPDVREEELAQLRIPEARLDMQAVLLVAGGRVDVEQERVDLELVLREPGGVSEEIDRSADREGAGRSHHGLGALRWSSGLARFLRRLAGRRLRVAGGCRRLLVRARPVGGGEERQRETGQDDRGPPPTGHSPPLHVRSARASASPAPSGAHRCSVSGNLSIRTTAAGGVGPAHPSGAEAAARSRFGWIRRAGTGRGREASATAPPSPDRGCLSRAGR